jgi:hypothetical protein
MTELVFASGSEPQSAMKETTQTIGPIEGPWQIQLLSSFQDLSPLT